MRVLALTRYSRLGASSRMRFYQYLPALAASDIDVRVQPLVGDDYLTRLYAKQSTNWLSLLGDYLARVVDLFKARQFDLIWIEKELFPNLPAWFERALAAMGVRYVVDYDDAIFHGYDHGHPAKRFLFASKIDQVMRRSALVVCGNAYLAERARAAGAGRVEIVPTVIDLERYAPAAPTPRAGLVIGWIGSPATVKYLDLVGPALRQLAADIPFQLRVIGAHFACEGVAVDCRRWSEGSEVEEIRDFDIGIMPLIDSPWERGKCGYKLIQYMACGKPVIASPVGVNCDIVRGGVNGYLAASGGEWMEALRTLLLDAQLRQTMGGHGRIAVEQQYCLQVSAPRMAKLLHEALPKGAN